MCRKKHENDNKKEILHRNPSQDLLLGCNMLSCKMDFQKLVFRLKNGFPTSLLEKKWSSKNFWFLRHLGIVYQCLPTWRGIALLFLNQMFTFISNGSEAASWCQDLTEPSYAVLVLQSKDVIELMFIQHRVHVCRKCVGQQEDMVYAYAQRCRLCPIIIVMCLNFSCCLFLLVASKMLGIRVPWSSIFNPSHSSLPFGFHGPLAMWFRTSRSRTTWAAKTVWKQLPKSMSRPHMSSFAFCHYWNLKQLDASFKLEPFHRFRSCILMPRPYRAILCCIGFTVKRCHRAGVYTASCACL